jgi:hypothetical protein
MLCQLWFEGDIVTFHKLKDWPKLVEARPR